MPERSANPADRSDTDIEAQINLASRLYALEYFVCHVLTASIPNQARSASEIDGMHLRMISGLGSINAGLVSEAHAEIALSEIHYAIRRLISLQREVMGLPRRPLPDAIRTSPS